MDDYTKTEEYKCFLDWKGAVVKASDESISRAAKADPSRTFGGHDRADDAPGHRWGTWLQAVRSSALGDSAPMQREMNRRTASGQAETPPSAGGFALEKAIANEILDVAYGSTIAGRCRKIPITQGNSLKLPAVDSSSRADASRPLRARFLEEAEEMGNSTAKMKQLTFDLKTIGCLVPVTQQLVDDAPALEAWMGIAAPREISYVLDRSIIRGSGAGSLMGIINAPCLVTQDAEAAQLQDTILAENLLGMREKRLPGVGPYVWLYSPNCFSQIMTMMHPGNGAPMFVPEGGLNARPFSTIMGDEAVECEHCSTLGDKGDVILAAFDQYILTQKGVLRADSSIHALFDTFEMAYRFVLRIDGMPALPSAVTLEQSGMATSAFLTLAARA